MEKYNFDVIFEGSQDDQRKKAGNFLEGVRRIVREDERAFAQAVLSGNSDLAESVFRHTESTIDAAQAFDNDPRTAVLAKGIRAETDAKLREKVTKGLDGLADALVEQLRK